MSSSVGANTNVPVVELVARPCRARRGPRATSSASSSPTSPSICTCAREPVEVVGREAPVEAEAHGEREQLVARALAEAAVPERRPVRVRSGSASSGIGRLLVPWRGDGLEAEAPEPHEAAASSWRNASAAS